MALPLGASASMAWGRHQLDLFQTDGQPDQPLVLEAAADGLLLVGQRLVGSIALIGDNSPEQAERALVQLRQRGMARIVPALLRAENAEALDHALTYLQRLRSQVGRARGLHTGGALHA